MKRKQQCQFCVELIETDELFYGKQPESKICTKCIMKAQAILSVEQIGKSESCLKTEQEEFLSAPHIYSKVSEHVIAQNDAKKRLSVAIQNHKDRCNGNKNIPKSNVFIKGSSGVGKTYLVERIADIVNLPMVILDATTITQSGFSGDDVDICIRHLLAKCNGDVQAAEKGIVFIDEIDKVASKVNLTSQDVSGRAVQEALLKLMEAKDVEISAKSIPGISSSNITSEKLIVNTRNVLFIVAGAFSGLEKFKSEAKKREIGFLHLDKNEVDEEELDSALFDYGLIPEFIGRFPVRIEMHDLSKTDYFEILTNAKGGICSQYINLFSSYGVELKFSDDGIEHITNNMMRTKTGVRSAQRLMQPVIDDLLFDIECLKDKNIVITIGAPEGKLTASIAEKSIESSRRLFDAA